MTAAFLLAQARPMHDHPSCLGPRLREDDGSKSFAAAQQCSNAAVQVQDYCHCHHLPIKAAEIGMTSVSDDAIDRIVLAGTSPPIGTLTRTAVILAQARTHARSPIQSGRPLA